MSVGVIIEHHVRPGLREQVHAIWDQLLRPAIAANLEHEAYSYMYDIEDVDVIRAFQQYIDAEAASRFLSTDAYAAYLLAVENLLVRPPTVTQTDIIWSKARELPPPQT
jgi:quinol monooxygenase YgiN